MKKLKKLDLEELANQMEQINNAEIESKTGAECYYNPNTGVMLGQVGSSSEITLVNATQEQFNYAQGGGTSYINSLFGARHWSSASITDKQNTLSKMAGMTVFPSPGAPNDALGNCVTTVDGSGVSSKISVNMNTSYFAAGNYYDLQLIVLHEQTHATLGMLNIENEDLAEFLAYKAVQDHPSYRLATQGMRDIIDNGVAFYSGAGY